MKHPDPKKHQQISFIKSGIRIVGYILIPFSLVLAASILTLSELIGIYEELVWNKYFILQLPGADLAKC